MSTQAASLLVVLAWTGLFASNLAAEVHHDCHHCEQGHGEQGHGEQAHCCRHGISTDPGRPKKPKRDKPGDINRGDCPPKRYLMNDCQRAGNPQCVAPWAQCAVTDKYSAWFVGGGAAYSEIPQLKHALLSRGRARKANGHYQHGEGTWGLDYSGLFGKANVWLAYTCGRNQGGEGAYETDGEPKIVAKLKSLIEHE